MKKRDNLRINSYNFLMKINIISDVHIKDQADEQALLLLKFLDQCQSPEVEEIILLGDIFDLLVGNHKANADRYGVIFNRIKKLASLGKIIWYFEGNHDLHLTKFFKNVFHEFWDKEFKLVKNYIKVERFSKKLYITHGDYLTDHEPGYQRYRRFASWKANEFIFENMIDFSLIEKVGNFFSKRSKKGGKKTFNFERAQEGFRKGAKKILNEHPVDYIIAGHSHIKDEHKLDNESLYLNNGFAPIEKTYLQLSQAGHKFIDL